MGEFERRELRDFEAEEEEAEETFQLQVQDSLAQAQRERDEAMTLANSLRVCLDAAEAERTSLHARLAVAEPKAVALDALEEWMAVQGQGIEAESGSCTAYVVLVDAEGGATMQALGSTLADLGTALVAQAATGDTRWHS